MLAKGSIPKPEQEKGSTQLVKGNCMVLGMQAAFAGATDVGRVRRCNEDSFLLLPEAGVFAVADGLGGLDAGDLASNTALTALRDLCLSEEGDGTDPISHLQSMVAAINRHTYEQRIAVGTNMATTLAVVRFAQQSACVGHVGDSRIYRWRKSRLDTLTHDHSLVNDLCAQGALTVDQTRHSPQRHVITRAVGAGPSVQPSIASLTLEPGDILLLCTDGLTSMVDDEAIAARMTDDAGDMSRLVEGLVGMANEAGGYDNITVVAIAVEKARQHG